MPATGAPSRTPARLRRYRRFDSKTKSGMPVPAGAPDWLGGPEWIRTLDPLIKSRGAVTSRPSVFLLTSAQLPDEARSPHRVVHDTRPSPDTQTVDVTLLSAPDHSKSHKESRALQLTTRQWSRFVSVCPITQIIQPDSRASHPELGLD